ncbi:TPA: hypothetical protein R5B02_001618 [Campylobacter jejuni]|nr:hypothetical protein [Campylobacter jejuni]
MKFRRDILTRKLTKAFAENGSKIEIPLDIQPSGSVSFNEGFGGLYSKPVKPQSEGEQAGLQIQRENINWLFNAITSDVIQNSDDLGALEDEVTGLITSLNTKTPKLLTENITWIVGIDGDYEDLEVALKEASKYVKNGFTITINLKAGFQFSKQILLSYCDLSNVIITSEEAIINIDSSILTQTQQGVYKPLFYFYNCTVPSIGVSIKLNSPLQYSTGIMVFGSNGIFSTYGKTIDGFNNGMYIERSFLSFNNINIKNSNEIGLVIASSHLTFSGSQFSENENDIHISGGSIAYMYQGNINAKTKMIIIANSCLYFFQSNLTQSSDVAVTMNGASIIGLTQCDIIGGATLPIAKNTLTSQGIIFG